MSLLIHDTLSLRTESGINKIQLCIGDITTLPKEEKVDVLVVSAFPGDYSPTPTSLIGALAINLGISVCNLSKDKEEDLRRQYFCWWSKPLPEQHSFKRILCFEGGFGSRGSQPPKVVGAVFRCLVPILSGKDNTDGSVVMPLLASGDQGYSKSLMLRLIMDSAIHWIKAGLGLKTLKIVLYSRNPQKYDKSLVPLFESFQKMKAKYDEKELAYETEVIYDVYMSHSPTDHEFALKIVKFLQTERNLSVFHDFQELNDDESWQEEIFNIMGKCARVIALLSPGYLEKETCIEQYNMALCINRRSRGGVLAPFYITSMDYMPTYMSLIQYEDCRPRDEQKIKAASHNVAESLKKAQDDEFSSGVTKPNTTLSYDVFISYSHQNKTHADKLLDTLRSVDPDLKIFIDTSGLNTGTSWQQLLYKAIDASKCTIALLSPDYIKSKVCYEEFCLSYALFVDKDRSMDLVSMLVEPVNELPLWCEAPLPIDCTSSQVDTDQILATVCTDLVNRLKGTSHTTDDILAQRVHDLSNLAIESAMENYRKSCFVMRSNVLKTSVAMSSSNNKESLRVSHASDVVMSVDGHHAGAPPESSPMTPSNTTSSQVTSSGNTGCDVALSFADKDKKSAIILKQLLLEKNPSLTISEPMAGDFSRVQSLDVARVIVPLLSPAFLVSNELVEELNIAIYRNRSSSRRILFPIQVSAIPPKPAYVHLIPCEFSSSDNKWANKINCQNLNDEVSQIAKGSDMDEDEVFCLKAAAHVISERLSEEREEGSSLVNQVLLNVHDTEELWKKVQQALKEGKGLEVWKRAFGMEIKSGEDDVKPARTIEQDEEKPDADTAQSVPSDTQSEPNKEEKIVRYEDAEAAGGVELDLNVIKNDGPVTATATSADHTQSIDSESELSSSPSSSSKNKDGSGRKNRRKDSQACTVL